MKKQHENKFTMYSAVNSILDEHRDLVSSKRGFEKSANEFNLKCAAIKSKAGQRRNSTAGKKDSKKRKKNAAVTGCLSVCAPVYSLASDMKDDELTSKIHFYRSHLEKMRDTELIEVLDSVYEIAKTKLDQLEPHGLDAAMLEDYKSRVASYSGAFSKSQAGVRSRMEANKSIPELFGEADAILLKLDKYVDGMTDEQPEFVKQYRGSRLIYKLGIRHEKDEETPAPENNALVPVASTHTGSNAPPEPGSVS